MRDRPRALRALDDPLFKKKWVNQASAYGWTCAHQAALDGDFIALSKLIEKGVDLWTLNKDDKYPMHYAVIESHYEIVTMILSLDIPRSVVEWYPKFSEFSDTSCWFMVAIELEDLRIEKLLVDAFFPLIEDHDMLVGFVHYALRRKNAYDIIVNVFAENVIAMNILRTNEALGNHLESGYACPKVVDFLLRIPGRIIPIMMNNNFLEKTMTYANKNAYGLLESFLRHPDKIIGINDNENLLHAVRNRLVDVVDLLLAVGCDPRAIIPTSNTTCFFEALKKMFYAYKLRDDAPRLIFYKFLMFCGNKDYILLPSLPPIQTVTGKVYHIRDFYVHAVINYCKRITLFDILYYRKCVDDLREKFLLK